MVMIFYIFEIYFLKSTSWLYFFYLVFGLFGVVAEGNLMNHDALEFLWH